MDQPALDSDTPVVFVDALMVKVRYKQLRANPFYIAAGLLRRKKGLPGAIDAVWELTMVQTYIIPLRIRSQ